MPEHQLKPFTIYGGDNLKMLNEIPDESVDLIYIDPPYNSNRNQEVFGAIPITAKDLLRRERVLI